MFNIRIIIKMLFVFILLMGFTGCSYLNELVSSESELLPSEQEEVRKEQARRVFSELLDANIINADDATYEEYIEVMGDIKAKDENVYNKCNQFLCQKSAEKYPKACEAYSAHLKAKQESATQIIELFDKDIQNAGEDIYRRYLELMDDVKAIDEDKYNQYNKFLCQEKRYLKVCGAYLSYLKANKEKYKDEYEKTVRDTVSYCWLGYQISCDVIYEKLAVFNIKTQGSFILYDSPFLKVNIVANPNLAPVNTVNMEISNITDKVTIHLIEGGKFNYQGMPCLEAIASSLESTDDFGEYPEMAKRCYTYPHRSWETPSAVKGTQKAIFIEVPPHPVFYGRGVSSQEDGFSIVIEKDQAKKIIDNYSKFYEKYIKPDKRE